MGGGEMVGGKVDKNNEKMSEILPMGNSPRRLRQGTRGKEERKKGTRDGGKGERRVARQGYRTSEHTTHTCQNLRT